MKRVLIGHRGVGKTDLLRRLPAYMPEATDFFDLDKEIEQRFRKRISAIFLELGESGFRELEQETFQALIQGRSSYVISLGAGFDLSQLPSDVLPVWVRRETDKLGRVFHNRPRLEKHLSPLEEYSLRFNARQPVFEQMSGFTYLMPEGIIQHNPIEAQIFAQIFDRSISENNGVLTLMPRHLGPDGLIKSGILSLQPDYFELRTDLLSDTQIGSLLENLPTEKILLSFRNSEMAKSHQNWIRSGLLWDWAFELGPCPLGVPKILSFHHTDGSLSACLKNFEEQAKKFVEGADPKAKIPHLKVSPEINSWTDLAHLLAWQQAQPDRRSILPRSADGRWQWLRLRLKGWQKLNFWRLDSGSAEDQPSLFQWLATPTRPVLFAAVLGSPVFHSRTPIEQGEFFAERGIPVFAIDIQEKDWVEAFTLLNKMGLQAAAVTSPDKFWAFRICDQITNQAKELRSVNTLLRYEGDWIGHNTDLDGFRFAWKEAEVAPGSSVAVWGGGGTLKVIQASVQGVHAYSSRSGERKVEDPVASQPKSLEQYDVVIWAAEPSAPMPPTAWRPKLVVDLNYREDSLAREYADVVGARYTDGLMMFRIQALAQREFWGKYLNDGK